MASFSLPIRNTAISPARETNDCGECTACCDILGVDELGKPAYAAPTWHRSVLDTKPAPFLVELFDVPGMLDCSATDRIGGPTGLV